MRIPAPPPPPPREPEQVTTVEQGAIVPHFRAASSSTQAPPMDKQAWNVAVAASEFLYPILNWGVDPRPPGDFVSYLGNPSSYPLPQQPLNQQAMLQHLHYSRGPSHYVPCPAPQPSPSIRKPRTPVKPSGSQQTISVDNAEDGDKRTEKRLAWTSQEDVRLASAIYASGQSDAQLLEKAHAFYESDYTAQFHHMDCWRAVNEHTKWTTYNEWLGQSKKRKMPETGEMGKHTSTPEDAEDIPRPPGIKKSKKECNGKAPQPSPSIRKPRTPVKPSGSQQTISVDNAEDGDKRTEKRLAWTSQDDVRLMSAWLSCSTDPINGNNKKSDQYWGDVTNVYNNTTPKNRRRQVK
ncbi:hypothetical protein ZWY2020_000396 [Hordeum vulgare]|nr:hypothetical protein ZWY2020_000396 [Hordeum vulgare]